MPHQRFRFVYHRRAVAVGALKEIGVFAARHAPGADVEAVEADFFDEVASEREVDVEAHHGRIADDATLAAEVDECEHARELRPVPRGGLARFPERQHATEHEVRVVFVECGKEFRDPIGFGKGVVVGPGDDVAAGLPNAAVAGVRDARRRFENDPYRQVCRVFGGDGVGLIGAVVIDDENFPIDARRDDEARHMCEHPVEHRGSVPSANGDGQHRHRGRQSTVVRGLRNRGRRRPTRCDEVASSGRFAVRGTLGQEPRILGGG